MPHICHVEILMLMSMVPFIGIYFYRIHAWIHKIFNIKCHTKNCDDSNLDHNESKVND